MRRSLKTFLLEDKEEELLNLVECLKSIKIIEWDFIFAGNLKEAAKLLRTNTFDVSFLDYELPDGNVDELIMTFPRTRFGVIVYTSVHETIDVNATIRIAPNLPLIKPFDEEDIKELIPQIVEFIEQNNPLDVYDLAVGTGIVRLYNDDILYIQSNKDYATFYCEHGKKYLIRATLKSLELLLNNIHFIRSHESFIINKGKIFGFGRGSNHGEIYFDNQKKLIAQYSESYRQKLIDAGVIRDVLGRSTK